MSSMQPKVFISYSWNSEEYKARIINFAERLVGDGVDVIIDAWDLKKGQNLHKFMEQMVASEEISKVLLIVDREYQRKANEGTGGVGTESEIVSAQIYNNAKQEKFIPVVFEVDGNQAPFLPTFLSSRVYVNLATVNSTDEYQDLLRAIYNKPQFIKPQIGKTPAFLEDGVSKTAPGIFFELYNALTRGTLQNKQFLVAAFYKSLAEQILELVVTFDVHINDDTIFENIQSFEPLSIEAFKTLDLGFQVDPSLFTIESIKFFENIKNKLAERDANHRYNEVQFSAASFVLQEILLDIVALQLRHEKFQNLIDIFESGIIVKRFGGNKLGSIFNLYEAIEVLDVTRNNRMNLRRTILTADIFIERAQKRFGNIEEIIQADVILFLRGQLAGEFWYPRTLVFAREHDSPVLFVRAEKKNYFAKIAPIFGVRTIEEFRELWKRKTENLGHLRFNFSYFDITTFCNISKLASK